VASIHYTTKEEALEFYKKQSENDPALTQNLSSNVFLASLDVSPKNIKDLNGLAALANDKKFDSFVNEVYSPRDITDRLMSWTSTGRLVGLGLIGFLFLVSFLIMLVTIGLNIASYQQEISVMRLVGA
jgi:cell division protein FtsX